MNTGVLTDAATTVMRRMGEAARDEVKLRNAEPCIWATYHHTLATTGRRFWRPWHRFRARHFRALCIAHGGKKLCPPQE